MLDYFNISFSGRDFPPLGKELKTAHPSGAVSHSFTEYRVQPEPGKGAPHFHVQVRPSKETMHFWGCPALWLQGHNGMGSDDFRGLVAESVRLVFATLQLPVLRSISNALTTGNFRVHEVHIAHLHGMPHALIPSMCEAIRRHAPDDMRACSLGEGKGIGVRFLPSSRSMSGLLYDKQHYFRDHSLDHARLFLGPVTEDWATVASMHDYRRMVDNYLQRGVRIELRLKRKLAALKLSTGSAWTADTARQIYEEQLQSIPLADLPAGSDAEALLRSVPANERRLLVAWVAGRDMREMFDSPSAFTVWRKRLSAYDIDIGKRPLESAGVSWSQLIAPTSIINTPRWAIKSGFVFVPGGKIASRLERVWLSGAPHARANSVARGRVPAIRWG